MSSESEVGRFLYLCVNLLMIAAGTLLSRRVYAVFGGLGATGYVGHLAYEVFKDSIAFPFILTGIGIAIVYLGVLWQRNEKATAARLRSILPAAMRQMIERRR
jgi:Ca2+/Na+ antiporter